MVPSDPPGSRRSERHRRAWIEFTVSAPAAAAVALTLVLSHAGEMSR